METVLIGSAILMGLVGNLHCLGMCGPISMVVPFKKSSKLARLLSVLVYNAGRILVYASIGAVFGLLGKGIALMGMQQYLSIIIGVLIILSVIIPSLFDRFSHLNSGLFSWVGKIKSTFRKQFSKTSYGALFVMGALNGMLPCGLVYMAAAGSLVTGTWYYGMAYMALFGLGTIPVMLAIPFVGELLKPSLRQRFTKMVPVFMFAFGLLMIVRGANLGIPYLSPQVTAEKSCCQIKCH